MFLKNLQSCILTHYTQGITSLFLFLCSNKRTAVLHKIKSQWIIPVGTITGSMMIYMPWIATLALLIC
jgi:hypothetical protein